MNILFKRAAVCSLSAVLVLSAVGTAFAYETDLAIDDGEIVVADSANTDTADSSPESCADRQEDIVCAVADSIAAVLNAQTEQQPPSTSAPTLAKAKARLNQSELHLFRGSSSRLKLEGVNQKVTWSSNKKSVATVSSKGKVTAKKAGEAMITAKVGKKKYYCSVVVTKDMRTEKALYNMEKRPERTIPLYWSDKLSIDDLRVEIDDSRIVSCELVPSADTHHADLRIKALATGAAILKISNTKTDEVIEVAVGVRCFNHPGYAALKEYISTNGETLGALLDGHEKEFRKALSLSLNQISGKSLKKIIETLRDVKFYAQTSEDGYVHLMMFLPPESMMSDNDMEQLLFTSSKVGTSTRRSTFLDLSGENAYDCNFFITYESKYKDTFFTFLSMTRCMFTTAEATDFHNGETKEEKRRERISKKIFLTGMHNWEQMLNNTGISFVDFGFLSYGAAN